MALRTVIADADPLARRVIRGVLEAPAAAERLRPATA
jgi:hypothetical protein